MKESQTLLIGVYQIVSPRGSRYIGATVDSFEARWDGHQKAFRYGKTRCPGLRCAFEKYGVDGMSWEILEVVPPELAETVWLKEQQWWDDLKRKGVNIYNGRPTGTGSVHHTEESRRKTAFSVSLAARLGKPPKMRPKDPALAHFLLDNGVEFLPEKLKTKREPKSSTLSIPRCQVHDLPYRRGDLCRICINELTFDLYRNSLEEYLSKGGSLRQFAKINGITKALAKKIADHLGIRLEPRGKGFTGHKHSVENKELQRQRSFSKPKMYPEERVCAEELCSNKFLAHRKQNHFCSRECAGRHNAKKRYEASYKEKTSQ